MSFKVSNSITAVAACVALAGTCVAAQNNRRDQRFQRQEQRREQRQEERRGFQPPPGKSGGFGAQPAANPAANAPQSQTQVQPQPQGRTRVFGPGPHAGDWLRRNRTLPLNQQLQELQNDPNFRKLPPGQQEQMRQRLQRFNSLTPEQQDRVLDRMEIREHLPPEQRLEENELARRYDGLPYGRQQAVRNAVRDLTSLSPQQRQERLSSPEFRSQFTDTEREIIGQALEIRPSQARPQPVEPPEN